MLALFYIGLLLSIIGGIWLLVVAFKTSILWGLGTFFIPFVGLVFVFMHWQVAKKPFLLSLLAVVLLIVPVMSEPALLNSLR